MMLSSVPNTLKWSTALHISPISNKAPVNNVLHSIHDPESCEPSHKLKLYLKLEQKVKWKAKLAQHKERLLLVFYSPISNFRRSVDDQSIAKGITVSKLPITPPKKILADSVSSDLVVGSFGSSEVCLPKQLDKFLDAVLVRCVILCGAN